MNDKMFSLAILSWGVLKCPINTLLISRRILWKSVNNVVEILNMNRNGKFYNEINSRN
jgi:hypothetical protein